MLTGERRYPPARRGGMVSLGKVAVPKPINLPSQRGTHSWGTRSSSSTPNAWGSSTLSPNTDGGNGSPSHLSGRPSSGGSGTRPSTASSDRTHDPIASAWGTNSRPSSASGALTSNHTSLTSLRPGSEETRPGSSQLSVSPSLSDNSVAWVAMESRKLGGTSLRMRVFFDFWRFSNTWFRERRLWKKHGAQDHDSYSRPGSSSGGVAPGKESAGNSAGDASITQMQNEPQILGGERIPCVRTSRWSTFCTPIAPGGFPMEPFPYYCPQIPPAALANPQQGPPPGPGPRGPHPPNGDIYRPHMHDAFMRPGMPFRPGFYPGPLWECSDPPYNRYSGQSAPDPGNSHGRPGGYGPSGHAMVSEQLESGHPQDTRGPYKVLLKQHDGLEGKDKEQKWDDMMATNASYPGKGDHQRRSSWENGWRADEKNNKEWNTRRIGEEFSSEPMKPRSTASMKTAFLLQIRALREQMLSEQQAPGKTIALLRQLKSLGHIKERMMENLCYLTLIPVIARCKRAKMKELAIQRIKQREKEEEERARDQKAKALAKLVELNKRTKAVESPSEALPGMLKANHKECVVVHDQLEPLQQDDSCADGDHPDNAPQTHDNRALSISI
uniref:Uncharacterized protein n=1 Tax=Salix viminalis TaxID=40686 RepID=A0A6N2K3S2_SALVM